MVKLTLLSQETLIYEMTINSAQKWLIMA